MPRPAARALGPALLALAVAGCGGTAELSGRVTYKGVPLTAGEVHVRTAAGVEVSGGIRPDGTYTVRTVPRGTHQVRIICLDEKAANEYFAARAGRGRGDPKGPDGKARPKDGPVLEMTDFSKIPAKYADYAKSNLTVEVNDSKVTKDFDLD